VILTHNGYEQGRPMKHVGPVRRNAYLASRYDAPAMLVRQVDVGTMQNFVYLLADKPGGEGLVVD